MDMIPQKEEALARELEELGYTVDLSFRQHGVVVIKAFGIETGSRAGSLADIGVPGSDFPFSPPAGIHVGATLGQVGQNNISASPLGGVWQYWSRLLPDWTNDRSARHIISYINKVFLDA